MNSERLPYFGRPPTRPPRPAADEPALRGKRVILSTPEGFVYDMRAASQVFRDGQGRAVRGHRLRGALVPLDVHPRAAEAGVIPSSPRVGGGMNASRHQLTCTGLASRRATRGGRQGRLTYRCW